MAYAASSYLPAILADAMAADLELSIAFVFGAFSAALLLQAVLAQALGRLVDRLGGRIPLAASSLVFAAGLATLGLSHNPAQLVTAWLVMGLGVALGLYDIAFAGLVGWFGAEARRPITGGTLIAGFASTIGWPLTACFQAEAGWRGACLAWAAIHLLLTLPLHLSQALAPLGAALVMQASARWTVATLGCLCLIGLACLMLLQAPSDEPNKPHRH